ncbi:MAG: PIN domain-containing protein [Halobacteria archaeon]|nr:PIN domain-containing protein [Halobacteria archaeon]
MSVLIDTGVFYAHQNRSSSRHRRAKESLTTVLKGKYGEPYTTDYVYDEAVTLALRRTGEFSESMEISDRILNRDWISLEHVSKNDFEQGVEIFEKYSDQDLSFTDAVTVAVMRERSIDRVLSFDTDFDGIVERLEPSY